MHPTGAVVQLCGHLISRERFVADLRRGDSEAAQLLVRQIRTEKADHDAAAPGLALFNEAFRPQIMRWLVSVLNGDEQAAEECWAEALERVHSRIEIFDASKSKFRTWAYNQARYAAQVRARQEARQAPLAPVDSAERGDPFQDRAQPLTENEKARIRAAFRQLSDRDQQLLRYRILQGIPPSEMGRRGLAGEIPEVQVKVYVQRALERLARLYAD